MNKITIGAVNKIVVDSLFNFGGCKLDEQALRELMTKYSNAKLTSNVKHLLFKLRIGATKA